MTRSLVLLTGAAVIAAGLSATAGAQSGGNNNGWSDVQTLPLNMSAPPPGAPAPGWHDHGGWSSGGWDDPRAAGDTRYAQDALPAPIAAPRAQPAIGYAPAPHGPPPGYGPAPAMAAPAYAPVGPEAARGYAQGPAQAPYGYGATRGPEPMMSRGEGYGAPPHQHAPGYARLNRGARIPGYWMSPRYGVSDWRFYGLGEPGYGRHWVRYYDDAVLVDDRGAVANVVERLDWDHPAMSDGAGYGDGREVNKYGGQAVGSYYAPPAPVMAPHPMDYRRPMPGPMFAPPPMVAYAPPPMIAYGAPLVTTTTTSGGGGVTTTTVSAVPAITTTTTTTEYVDEVSYRTVSVAPHRAWHRPVRRVPCCCLCTR